MNKKYFLVLIIIFASSCGTMRNGRSWGEDARLLPGWERIQKAAIDAAISPETFVPLFGALIIKATNSDLRISDWAAKNNPIFNSQKNADRYSDYLLYISRMSYYTSLALTPSGNDVNTWISSKIKGAVIGLASTQINENSVRYIKHEEERLRPDKTDFFSFPSGHTSKMAVHNMLTLRNLENSDYFRRSNTATALHISMSTLTLAMAWSRIEAKRHYPTDVLIGAAIGNFVGSFIHDAFIGIDHNHDIEFSLSTIENNLSMNFSMRF